MSTKPQLATRRETARRESARPKTVCPTIARPNTKRTGEFSEAAFLLKAVSLGLRVTKPWGDSERYDFVIHNGQQFLRVQIKGTRTLRAGAYETRATYTVGKGRAVYTSDDIDFLVAHIIPLNVFYVLPVDACQPSPMLRFYPHRHSRSMRLEPYREAWNLLRVPK